MSLKAPATSVLVIIAIVCFAGSAAARSPRKNDPQADLVACVEKIKRLSNDVDEAVFRYGQALIAQGYATGAPWKRETCQALKAALGAIDRSNNWKGQESPTCAQIINEPLAQAKVEKEAADANKLRVRYVSQCR